MFYSRACAFSKALLPLMEEVAQHYSKQSIKFLRVDTGELAYSNMIKMGITTTPVVRLHTQVQRLTFTGNRTLSDLTDYITEYTEISTLPWKATGPLPFDEGQMPYTQAPQQVLYAIEPMWRQPFIHRRWSGVQHHQQQ